MRVFICGRGGKCCEYQVLYMLSLCDVLLFVLLWGDVFLRQYTTENCGGTCNMFIFMYKNSNASELVFFSKSSTHAHEDLTGGICEQHLKILNLMTAKSGGGVSKLM